MRTCCTSVQHLPVSWDFYLRPHRKRGVQALREVEREKARQQLAGPERQDLTYLKNILLKLFETGARTRDGKCQVVP